MEQSAWTWRDAAGRPYQLDRISCAWRRAADRTPAAAAAQFGPVTAPGEGPEYWTELHGILAPLTTLWEPDTDGVERFIPVPGSLPRVIRVLVHYYAPEDHEPRHVYLGEARVLRADLESAQ